MCVDVDHKQTPRGDNLSFDSSKNPRNPPPSTDGFFVIVVIIRLDMPYPSLTSSSS
jgi:hypothetical protein